MKPNLFLVTIVSIMLSFSVFSETKRISQFSNDKVEVWETHISPGANKILKMHRHENDRVIIAFDDGVLKITNSKGKTHFLKLEKNKAYYLKKDIPNELHSDENISSHPIKVMVIELRS